MNLVKQGKNKLKTQNQSRPTLKIINNGGSNPKRSTADGPLPNPEGKPYYN